MKLLSSTKLPHKFNPCTKLPTTSVFDAAGKSGVKTDPREQSIVNHAYDCRQRDEVVCYIVKLEATAAVVAKTMKILCIHGSLERFFNIEKHVIH